MQKEFRRRGLGALLLRGADRLAQRACGVAAVFLHVEEDNGTALRLYQRAGFARADMEEKGTSGMDRCAGCLAWPQQETCGPGGSRGGRKGTGMGCDGWKRGVVLVVRRLHRLPYRYGTCEPRRGSHVPRCAHKTVTGVCAQDCDWGVRTRL